MKYTSLFSLVAISCCLQARGIEDQEECGQSVRPSRVTLRHIEQKGVGYDDGYSTLEGFFSPSKARAWVPFLDLRGHIFNNGKPAANGGVGLRYVGSSRVWGLSGYYDYRKTRRHNYNQVSLGLESLGSIFDARLNGYLPVGKTESHLYDTQFAYFKEHYLFLRLKREFALKGANAEVGFHVDNIPHIPFYFATGPYYLAGHGQAAWGGEARFSVDFYDYFRLEGNTSYDHLFKWIGQGQISFNIPFGPRERVKKSQPNCHQALSLRNRALQRVDRNEIIPVDKKAVYRKAIDPNTNEPFVFWFVDNRSSSLGTFESPFPTMTEAQDSSSEGQVIYVFPGTGANYDPVVLKNSQWLFGASVAHQIQTTEGAVTIPAFASFYPAIYGAAGHAVTVAEGNVIEGLLLQNSVNPAPGPGEDNFYYAIYQTDASIQNLTVNQNIISGVLLEGFSMPYGGVYLQNISQNLVLSNNTFLNQQNSLLFTVSSISNASYLIQGNTFLACFGVPNQAATLSFTDCSALSVDFVGNEFITGTGLVITLNNTIDGLSQNNFGFKNNLLSCSNTDGMGTPSSPLIAFSLSGLATSSINVSSNEMISAGGPCLSLTLEDTSQLATTMVDNRFIAAGLQGSSGTGLYFSVNAATADTALLTATVKDNVFMGYNNSVPVSASFANSSQSTLDFLSNQCKGSFDAIALTYADTASGNFACISNLLEGFENRGVNVSVSGQTNLISTARSNTFIGITSAPFFFSAAGDANVCLTLESNTVLPTTGNAAGEYQLSNDSSNPFNYTQSNNLGSIIESGSGPFTQEECSIVLP